MLEDPYSKAASILRANRYLSLGTTGHDGPWVSPVAYVIDSDLSLIFYSEVLSRHGLNIASNPRVAGAIFDSSASSEEADGLQFEGIASIVEIGVTEVTDLYFRMSFPAETERSRWARPAAAFEGASPLRFYRIVIGKIFKLDTSEPTVDKRIELHIPLLKSCWS
jgi:uncharacterized protein YhbP (UPF0306 family)